MKLNQSEIAYGQQKNREHIYNECKVWFHIVFGRNPKDNDERDQAFLDTSYEIKCDLANITPW